MLHNQIELKLFDLLGFKLAGDASEVFSELGYLPQVADGCGFGVVAALQLLLHSLRSWVTESPSATYDNRQSAAQWLSSIVNIGSYVSKTLPLGDVDINPNSELLGELVSGRQDLLQSVIGPIVLSDRDQYYQDL